MIVRACQPSDFNPALDLITAAALHDRTRRISEQAFRSAFVHATQVGHNAAVATMRERNGGDSVLAGFVWWDIQPNETLKFEGWVHPDWRRRGVGTALLAAVESYAASAGIPLAITARVFSDIPGATTLFRMRGFTESRRFYQMSIQFSAPVPDFPIPPGIEMRTYQPADLEALVDADNTIFLGHWESYTRTVEQWQHELIDTRPHDPSLWILAWDQGRVVGECLSHLSREAGPEDSWIANLGVRQEWRGKGLSSALLARGLQAVQNAGYKTASLHVDGNNTPAVRLYRRLGLDITRTRLHYAKKIPRNRT